MHRPNPRMILCPFGMQKHVRHTSHREGRKRTGKLILMPLFSSASLSAQFTRFAAAHLMSAAGVQCPSGDNGNG